MRDIRTDEILTLAALKEDILDLLGKRVVSFKLDFDVGYMSGNQRICFLKKDFLSAFQEATKGGSQLWCEGITPPPKRHRSTLIVNDDVST